MRKLEARVADRRPNPIATLAHGGVGQADHREVGKTKGDIDLDVNGESLDPEDGSTAQACEHEACRCKNRCPRLLDEMSKDHHVTLFTTSQIMRSPIRVRCAKTDNYRSLGTIST